MANRIAILADVHANLPALEAVAFDLRERGADEVWHLGDAVGYGADHGGCLQLLTDLSALLIAGNHELAVLDTARARTFSDLARDSILWTASRLSPPEKDLLASLPREARPLPGFLLFHGFPGNPSAYIRTEADGWDAFRILEDTDPRVKASFFGHTHHRRVFTRLGTTEVRVFRPGAEIFLSPGRGYLVNPGSVGQPRDGDPRAQYLLFEPARRRVVFRDVEYDVSRAQESILAEGLPPALAARLSQGL